MAVKCSHCGTENAAGKLCSACGQPLPKVCARCGTVNDPNDRFCASCGGPLEDQPAVEAAPAQAPAYPAQTPAYPAQTPAYPAQTPAYPAQTPAYPAQAPAYPAQTPAYPAQTPAYSAQAPAYPPQAPAYQQQAPGYPPQAPAYQQQAPGYQQQGALAYQPQPAVPPGYYPAAAPPQKRGWVKWVSIITSILVVLLGGLKLVGLFSGSGSPTVATVATGQLNAQPEFYDSVGQFFASGHGTTADFYTFDEKGAAKQLTSVQDSNAGKLLGVVVADVYNNGKPVMLAYYERKLYVVTQAGTKTPTDVAVSNILVGDYDGDGKNETIFVDKDKDGKDEYQYWRFSAVQDQSKELIALGGRTAPTLFNAKVRIGQKDYILGYTNDNAGLQMILYQWDGLGGPMVFHKYPVKDSSDAPAEWISAGQLGQDQVLLVSYGGNKPAVEVVQLSKDGASAKSLGAFTADGQGSPAITIGTFTGKDPEILAVDKQGKYFIYKLK